MDSTEELSYIVFYTPYGWVGLLASDSGLRRVTLPLPSAPDAEAALGDEIIDRAVVSTDPFRDLMPRFHAYFTGRRVEFPDALDFSGFTPFQRSVWEAARRIPYGETRSYGWLARQIGKPGAARAVGQALGRNPFPIIVPCHRVLAGDGGAGGFSGGLAMKEKLLALEKTSKVK
ncbi:MAG: methylated-DNA--[protein]-cysteine S-methyltransferase [Dehalococcoidales bacterium]|jgi:methylated-DNA-[protein]-cysteine S-methyltransferase